MDSNIGDTFAIPLDHIQTLGLSAHIATGMMPTQGVEAQSPMRRLYQFQTACLALYMQSLLHPQGSTENNKYVAAMQTFQDTARALVSFVREQATERQVPVPQFIINACTDPLIRASVYAQSYLKGDPSCTVPPPVTKTLLVTMQDAQVTQMTLAGPDAQHGQPPCFIPYHLIHLTGINEESGYHITLVLSESMHHAYNCNYWFPVEFVVEFDDPTQKKIVMNAYAPETSNYIPLCPPEALPTVDDGDDHGEVVYSECDASFVRAMFDCMDTYLFVDDLQMYV